MLEQNHMGLSIFSTFHASTFIGIIKQVESKGDLND